MNFYLRRDGNKPTKRQRNKFNDRSHLCAHIPSEINKTKKFSNAENKNTYPLNAQGKSDGVNWTGREKRVANGVGKAKGSISIA